MIIRTLNQTESSNEMQKWIKHQIMPKVDDEYLKIREQLQQYYKDVKEKYAEDFYAIDIHMGIYLYNYLWTVPGFSMRAASNDDFWRYLSLMVIPDVVSERWGADNESHFWKRASRIWLRAIWWYIHLSWQGNTEETLRVIESPNFSTDEIMNLVERAGRKGYYIPVYRNIMEFYSKVPDNVRREHKDKDNTLFRSVMKLNTARYLVTDPALCEGGEREYVRSLFRDLNVIV